MLCPAIQFVMCWTKGLCYSLISTALPLLCYVLIPTVCHYFTMVQSPFPSPLSTMPLVLLFLHYAVLQLFYYALIPTAQARIYYVPIPAALHQFLTMPDLHCPAIPLLCHDHHYHVPIPTALTLLCCAVFFFFFAALPLLYFAQILVVLPLIHYT